MRVQLSTFRTSLSAALGLAALACGGNSTHEGTGGDDDRSGGSGGTTTVTGGSGGRSGMGGGKGADLSCQNPRPVLGFDGSDTGFVACDPGFTHRPERRDCPSSLPRPGNVDTEGASMISCMTDADCSSMPHGYCARITSTFGGQRTTCLSGCVRDDECAAGMLCFCGDPVGTCVTATCTSDANCSDGLLCTGSPKVDYCASGTLYGNFACQTSADECRSDQDCTWFMTVTGPAVCSVTPEGRKCSDPGACGRPFLVDGEARLACVMAHDTGWSSTSRPCVLALDQAVREELADHYGRIGAMEHASVAAFARFTLELMALGAPSELLLASQRALGDEIRHATTCFGLASAYAARPLGPGALATSGSLDDLSFEGIVHRAILEACIGETLAAVEALEAAAHAIDPAVRHALQQIAEDEKRHAELGWRFLRWALERATPPERSRLETLLADAVADARARVCTDGSETDGHRAELLLAHGVLSPSLVNATRAAALDELVVPLARELVQAMKRGASYGTNVADKTTVPSSSSIFIVS